MSENRQKQGKNNVDNKTFFLCITFLGQSRSRHQPTGKSTTAQHS